MQIFSTNEKLKWLVHCKHIVDKKVDSGLHDEPNLCIDILTQSAREEYKDKTSRQEASNGQRFPGSALLFFLKVFFSVILMLAGQQPR